MSLTSPIFLSSAPMTSVPLNLDARNWSCRCELMNFAELVDDTAELVEDGAGVLISVDFAEGAAVSAGAGITAGAGVADGAGVAAGELGDAPSAAAPPTIKAVKAVVIMSFFSIKILLKPFQESRI